MLWAEKNRKAMQERKLCIPGTDDAFLVGVTEDEPPHPEKPGARWVLIHIASARRFIARWALGQVAFLANWMYRRFPKDHPLWTETDPETVSACLTPLLQQGFDTEDWSEYQNARRYEIEDEMARMNMLAADYGIPDNPDNELPEGVLGPVRFQREQNQSLGCPRPGMGYEDSPNQEHELFTLRLTYIKRKYMR
jgi:hypothetical protein